MIDLTELRALTDAATPGPWGIDEATPGEIAPLIEDEFGDPDLDWGREIAAVVSERADGIFIAALNPEVVRTLLAAVEAAQAAAERLGELTSPPWILSLTPLIAEVRDNLRAALIPFTEEQA